MKQLMLAMLTAGLGVAGVVGADNCCYQQDCCPQPCCMPSCCGSFEVGAEALYFKPSACDLGYAIRDHRAFTSVSDQELRLPYGDSRCANPGYQWGFRVMAGYVFDGGCSDVTLDYTHINFNGKNHCGCHTDATEGGIWATVGHPKYGNGELFSIANYGGQSIEAEARAKAKWRYDAANLLFGSRSMKGCDMHMRAFVGLHYANINHKFLAHFRGWDPVPDAQVVNGVVQTVDICNQRKVWGIGPRFGFEGTYDLFCGFGIGARLGVGLLAGNSRGRFHEKVLYEVPQLTAAAALQNVEGFPQECNVNYKSCHKLFPEVDARLGVNYTWCCSNCFTLLVEVGWEFISYINAVGDDVFNDEGGTSNQNCYSFNMDGLYIMGRIMF